MTGNHLLLYRLAELMFEKEQHVLSVDDLFDDTQIGDFVKSIQIDSPYQQLLFEGVLTESVKEEKLYVSFTVEGYFHYVLGEVVYTFSYDKDAEFLIQLLLSNNLNGLKEGIEQCLIRDVNLQEIERLRDLIDTGGYYLEICIRPLLHFMKIYGVDTTLDKILENPTDNDWKAFLQLSRLMDELVLLETKEIFLKDLMRYNSFNSKEAIWMAIKSCEIFIIEEVKVILEKINICFDLIENDSDILFALGEVYEQIGDLDQAFKIYHKGLDIELKIFGNKHPNVGNSYGYIGSIYQKKGDFKQAILFKQKGLEIQKKSLGIDHSYVAISNSNIGSVWLEMEDYNRAIKSFQKCLEVQLKNLGTEHPNTSISYSNIGLVWGLLGDHEKSLEFSQKSLNICLKLYGPEHREIATNYNNIGIIWNNIGNFEKSLEFYHKCLDIQLRTIGSDYEDVAISYNNIATVWNNMEVYDKALEFYNKCINVQLNTIGDEHPKLAITYSNISSAYYNQGEYDNAIDFSHKELDIRLKNSEEDHSIIAVVYNNIGHFFECKGDFKKALEYYNKCLEIELITVGHDHTDTANSYLNIGECYENMQNLVSAIDSFKKGFLIDGTGRFLFRIASCLEKLGDKKEALNHYIQAAEIQKEDPEAGLDDSSTQESINNFMRLFKEIDLDERAIIPEWLKKYVE
jgi:tetratricopeptide (TPR) repeat protein